MLNAISMDCNLDRRTVLKFVAGVSASAVAPHTSVSAPVLANNGEIIALSARAAADYIKRGELSAERYAQVPTADRLGNLQVRRDAIL